MSHKNALFYHVSVKGKHFCNSGRFSKILTATTTTNISNFLFSFFEDKLDDMLCDVSDLTAVDFPDPGSLSYVPSA